MTTAAGGYHSPPRGELTTTSGSSARSTVDETRLANPSSVRWESSEPKATVRDMPLSALRTQKEVESSSAVKRLQQDLLILTGFNDNSSLHWQPAWFKDGRFKGTMWTLHNPPNIVTEPLPNDGQGIQMYTRRMRRGNDPPPLYIKDWDHWVRYCDIFGIPHNFLNKEQVRLVRMGLPRSADGSVCPPPRYPLYPEPSPQGSHLLTPSACSTHLPRKFQQVVFKTEPSAGSKRGAASLDEEQDNFESVVVETDGKLSVVSQEEYSRYPRAAKCYRWSYVPWTAEMEKSCRPMMLKLRLWNEIGNS